MASKKGVVVTVRLNKEISDQVIACANKEVAENYLFVTASRQWAERLHSRIMPATRKGVMETFYGEDTGNSYRITSCTVVDSESITAQAKKTTEQLKARNGRPAVQPVGKK